MMKRSVSVCAKLVACSIAIALISFRPLPVWADTRLDAVFELSRLDQPSPARHRPDEIKSAEATLAIAEHYFQTGAVDQAERFYLLAIQKTRIILASLPAGTADPASDSEAPPADAAAETLDIQPPPAVIPDDPQQAAPEPAAETPQAPAELMRESDMPVPQPEAEYLSDEVTSERLVGAASTYSVVRGDTIRLIAAKLGVSRQHIIRQNSLDEKAYLKIGRKLAYNNRKIVPQWMRNGIVVNIPDRTLYYFKQGKLAVSLPVALGVPLKSDKYDWKTPTGKFRITAKMKDPTWHVPPSIQSEMEEHGKEIITSIAPGPTNPLGKYAFKTSISGILIHSTTKPWSIYSFASHGCIRVYPQQMEELFKEVTVNTPGEIIYKPVKLAITEQGRVFLEVHRDVYGLSSGLALEARRLIEKRKLAGQVDWSKVESMVQRKSGIAEDISL